MKIILVTLSVMLPLVTLAAEDSELIDPSIEQSKTKILLSIKAGENASEKMREAGILPAPDPYMTKEEIEQSVKDFMDNINFESMISLSEPGRLSKNKLPPLDKYTIGDDFFIRLEFKTNVVYPVKYSFKEYFKDDPSPEFYHLTSNRIFKEILGDSYKNFAPILRSSSKRGVSIEAIFRNESELRHLLSLPGLVKNSHLGTPITSEEVLPIESR